ncbi:hypothetical protein DMJ13_19235 [halophilic archaeon]|nr:hypothetical protein DMJ13_19235 [halophilic archaeon]
MVVGSTNRAFSYLVSGLTIRIPLGASVKSVDRSLSMVDEPLVLRSVLVEESFIESGRWRTAVGVDSNMFNGML